MSYFSFFPKRNNYPITVIGNDNTKAYNAAISFPDFFRSVALLSPKINDRTYYYYNQRILDGERPDQLSMRLYGTPNYFWTFFVINPHLRLGESLQWPMQENDLRRKIANDFTGKALTSYKSRYIKGFLPQLCILKDNTLIDKSFVIGERITGLFSGAYGNLLGIRPDHGQLIIEVESLQQDFNPVELVQGSTSNETILIHSSIEYADAPYYYLDSEEREVSNRNFIKLDDIQTETLTSVSYREHYMRMNETLSEIRVLNKPSVGLFADAYRKLIEQTPIINR